MTTAPGSRQQTRWGDVTMSDQNIADALECDVKLIREIVSSWACRTLSTVSATLEQRHGPQTSSRLAVAHALHTAAGLAVADAAAVAAGCWQVSASMLRIVDFRPRNGATAIETGRDLQEPDPFMLFSAHASEAIPMAAVDEYLDVVDGRRVYWRKPRRNAYVLACELHRLSTACRLEDTPALQEEYLELLASLREPADHACEWIGTVADGRFRPAPDRFAERSPTMRQGPEAGTEQTSAESYASKISVNVSLAARSMKRRARDLAMTNPLPSKTSIPNQVRAVP